MKIIFRAGRLYMQAATYIHRDGTEWEHVKAGRVERKLVVQFFWLDAYKGGFWRWSFTRNGSKNTNGKKKAARNKGAIK